MAISLRDLNEENFYECISLKVKKEQEDFVAPNLYSIAEAKVKSRFNPYVIYYNETIVGFLILNYQPYLEDKNKYWVARFMIDEKYQGKGYGKEGMKQLISKIRDQEDCTRLRLAYVPENMETRKFYDSLGFQETGEWLDDEMILELMLA